MDLKKTCENQSVYTDFISKLKLVKLQIRYIMLTEVEDNRYNVSFTGKNILVNVKERTVPTSSLGSLHNQFCQILQPI